MGRVHALAALRPPLGDGRPHRRRPRARLAHRPGARPGGDLPVALELRARGAAEPARPPARAERLGEEHHRGCLMAALEHYSTLDEGALYRFNWVFPSNKTIRGSLGFGQRGDAGQIDTTRATPTSPTTRSTRSSSSRSATTRSSSSRSPSAARSSKGCSRTRAPAPGRRRGRPRTVERGRRRARAAVRLAPSRAALAQEPAGLRGAARELPRVVHRGAEARAGGALLHLAALPDRRGHDRPADERRRGRAAGHGRPLARGAPRVAPGDHALRGEGRARRGGRRPPRVQRFS